MLLFFVQCSGVNSNSYMESEGQIITEAIFLASFLPKSKQDIFLIKSAKASNRGQKRHFIIILNAYLTNIHNNAWVFFDPF